MRSLFSSLVIAIGVLTFTSCNPSSKYSAELEEIDSCLTVLDEMEADLNGIEFDSLMLMRNHVLRNEDSIQVYYHPDTLSIEIGKRMNECKGIRKSLEHVETKEAKYRDELVAVRIQFKNLKSDIENGILTEEEVKQYLEDEKLALINLNNSFHDFYILQESQKKFYYSAVPVIDELIEQLKSEAQLEE